MLGPGPAMAHGRGTAAGLISVAFVVLVAALTAGYGRGVHELWHRRGLGGVLPYWRVMAFVAGLTVLVAAQSDAVHGVAERSFAGHMGQHMILLVLAGPLLAAGAAGLPLTLAVPRRLRRGLTRWRAGRVGRWLRRPAVLALVAATAQAGVLWSWHLPGPYLLALADPVVHGAEHASLAAAAWLLWSLVLGARQHRLSGPLAVLLLFATMMPASALAAVLTFAPAPLYPHGALAPDGGDPLVDQQLAGLVMWIPMDVAVLAVGVVVFLGWLRQIERTTPSHRDLRPDDGFIAQAEG
ncbi:cytochrome c oxidase assembly protein [Micromonospora sp. NPDC049679]|uniref:cytochrome c oxidase assembly protein n=1 Tax=Micromonospora sp. NPDC049679 TaxID=3155920 RepID=UPI0033FE48AF